jgi:hypothetical protein
VVTTTRESAGTGRAGSRLFLAVLVGAAVFLGGCSASSRSADGFTAGRAVIPLAPHEAPYRVLARVRVAAVGDVLVTRVVRDSAAVADHRDGERSLNFGGYGPLFAGVAPDLRDADIAFANLETPVVPRPQSDPSRPRLFHAPPALLGALRAAGITVVSLANNHIYDQGQAGLEATLDEVTAAELLAVGAGKTPYEAERPLVIVFQSVRIAFLGYAEFFNNPLPASAQPNSPSANRIDPDRMVEAVQRARREADFVTVSVHWGVEYAPAPRRWQIDLAYRLLDAGADVILGHHPHVLQPIEVYRTRDGRTGLVMYSLGNFISNQGRLYAHGVTPDRAAEPRDGVLLRFVVEKRDYGAGVIRTELTEVRYVPLWTDNDTLDSRGRSPATIRVVTIERALAATRTQLEGILIEGAATGLTAEQATAYAALQIRLDMLLRRKAGIAKRVGEEYLSEP